MNNYLLSGLIGLLVYLTTDTTGGMIGGAGGILDSILR